MQQGDLWQTGRRWMSSIHDYPLPSTSHTHTHTNTPDVHTHTHTHRIYRQTVVGVRLASISYCDLRDKTSQPQFFKSTNWGSLLMRETPGHWVNVAYILLASWLHRPLLFSEIPGFTASNYPTGWLFLLQPPPSSVNLASFYHHQRMAVNQGML